MPNIRGFGNFVTVIVRSITRNQPLPLYPAKKFQAFRQSDACTDILLVPANQIPSFQLILPTGSAIDSADLYDACDDTLVSNLGDIVFSSEVIDYDGDDSDEQVITVDGSAVDPGATGNYYLRLVLSTPSAGGGEVLTTYWTEAFRVGCDYDYIIEWSKDCAYKYNYYGGGYKNKLYIESDETRPEYEKIIEGAEDGRGDQHSTWYRNRKFIRLKFGGADFLLDALNSIEHHNQIRVYDVAAGDWHTVDNFTVAAGGAEDDIVYPVTVRFSDRLDAEDACTDCDIYENAPFGSGDYPTNPRNPNNEEDGEFPLPDCGSFAVSVAKVGNELRATISGSPGGCTNQITWYLDGDEVGTGSTILLGSYGVYRAEAVCGGCFTEDSYTYLNPCANLAVTITETNGLLTANVTGNTGSPSYVWYRIDAGVPVQVSSGTNTYQALTTATYQVQVNDGACQVITSIYVNLDSCSISASITKDGDILTVAATGCTGGVVYTWEVDRGDGAGYVALPETSTELDTEGLSGTYRATVDCDSCEASDTMTIIDCAYQECKELEISISKVGNQLNAIVSGCAGAQTINWYKSESGTYTHIGVGNTINATTNGNYKAVVTCDSCTATAEIPVLDCEACDLSIELTEDPAGTLTAAVTGCTGDVSYSWEYIGNAGPVALPDTTAAIEMEDYGVYKVTASCDGCEIVGYYHYCEGSCTATQGEMTGCN